MDQLTVDFATKQRLLKLDRLIYKAVFLSLSIFSTMVAVWPVKSRQMSIKVAQNLFH